jgi:predicted PurR-regulated permease PerM
MNNEIPPIWLIVSGLFFFVGILAFVATLVVLYKLVKLAEELKPKVDSLSTKVEALVAKVDRVSDRVEGIVESVQHNVDGVSGGAKSIIGVVERLTKVAGNKADVISPIVAGGFAVFRLFKTFQAMKHQAHEKKPSTAKALPEKKG